MVNVSSGLVDSNSLALDDITSTVVELEWNNTVGVLMEQEHDHCVPLKKNYVQFVSVLPAFAAIENLVVLLALACYRRKLKHNNVYRYVASALIANVVTSALAFYHFLNYYYGFEPHSPNLWWAFRKGMTMALSLILSGNIGLLIYGIEDNTYIVGRISKSPQQSQKLSPVYKRRKANLLIFLVWLLPTVYGMLAMTPWNCTFQCTCTLSYDSGKPICPQQCSKLYTPMSKSYLLVIVCLWALECGGLLYLMWKSFYAVRHSDKDIERNGNHEQKYLSFRRALTKYEASHRVVALLFILFFFCSAPLMVILVLDFAVPDISFSHVVINFITPLPLFYCLFSPILVSQKLSGVRSALLMTVASCSCKNLATPRNRRSRKRSSTGAMSITSKDYSNAT